MAHFLIDLVLLTNLYLIPNRSYNIGRKRRENNHIIAKDLSVSARHATVELRDNKVFITDVGSKRGTFVNEQQIRECTELKDNDVILVGLNDCRYRLSILKWKVYLHESLGRNLTTSIKSKLSELGIEFTQTYSNNCTHFCTKTLCKKTLQENKDLFFALIDRKIITTWHYWTDLYDNANMVKIVPDHVNYSLPISYDLIQEGITELTPTLNRRFFLENTMFLFLDHKIMEEHQDVIEKCEGSTKLYTPSETLHQQCLKDTSYSNYIFVNNDKYLRPSFKTIDFLKAMKRNNKRIIEINVNDVYLGILKISYENFPEMEELRIMNRRNGTKIPHHSTMIESSHKRNYNNDETHIDLTQLSPLAEENRSTCSTTISIDTLLYEPINNGINNTTDSNNLNLISDEAITLRLNMNLLNGKCDINGCEINSSNMQDDGGLKCAFSKKELLVRKLSNNTLKVNAALEFDIVLEQKDNLEQSAANNATAMPSPTLYEDNDTEEFIANESIILN